MSVPVRASYGAPDGTGFSSGGKGAQCIKAGILTVCARRTFRGATNAYKVLPLQLPRRGPVRVIEAHRVSPSLPKPTG